MQCLAWWPVFSRTCPSSTVALLLVPALPYHSFQGFCNMQKFMDDRQEHANQEFIQSNPISRRRTLSSSLLYQEQIFSVLHY
mmetsp:Transcript_16496/g.46076  ORF Transcript_16496/g.46076 Transcript_16496/m.46076 type:complete len:82 (-) Transcript_16496:2130-2375(-)